MLFMLGAAEWIQVGQLFGVVASTIIQITQMVAIKNLLDNITNGAWLLEQARKWGLFFDKILINFSDKIYSYFNQIIKGTLITPSVTEEFMSRIYILVGIVIFFRLAMIAMKYMVNPDQFLDDKLGAQTLVKRVILGSLFIILIPFVFKTANQLQVYIIEDRVIERIILKKDIYKKLTKNEHQGKELAMMVFKGFFSWNQAVLPDSSKKVHNQYTRVISQNDISSFPDKNMTQKIGDEYVILYVPIISTLAVGYLLYMLIKYAIEVAFRSIKLVFMQLISPFVIVSYMLDPAKEEVMKKWTNITLSTYILIFIRVITLWFATLICYYLTNGIPTAEGETSLLNEPDSLLKALIILALFAFLKDLPKMLSEIFGYNLQENETIGGIMNQGVGVLKGLAIGQVGLGFAKKQMGYSIANSAVGGISGGLGAVSGTMQQMQGQGAGKIALSSAANASNQFGRAGSSITSVMGQTLSTGMGSTVLSPIASAGGIAANAEKSYPYSNNMYIGDSKKDGQKNSDEKNDEKDITLQTSNQMYQNIMNDAKLQKYIEGDRMNLMDQRSNQILNTNGSTISIDNPIVNEMSTEIHKLLSENNIETPKENVTARIKSLRDDPSFEVDFSSCGVQEFDKIVKKVCSDIQDSYSKIEVPTPNTVQTSNGTGSSLQPQNNTFEYSAPKQTTQYPNEIESIIKPQNNDPR